MRPFFSVFQIATMRGEPRKMKAVNHNQSHQLVSLKEEGKLPINLFQNSAREKEARKCMH